MTASRTTVELKKIGRSVCSRYNQFDFSYISGSLVEGFGNDASDLDIFIVGDAVELAESQVLDIDLEERSIHIDYEDGIRTDVEIWSSHSASDAIENIMSCSVDDWKGAIGLSDASIDFAHRTLIGLPLESPVEFSEFQRRINGKHVSSIIAQRFLYSYNIHVEDAVGAIQAGDVGATLLNSRAALATAADARAAAAGATNTSFKWRLHRLESHVSPELAQRYLHSELDESNDASAVIAKAKKRLQFASELATTATRELLGSRS